MSDELLTSLCAAVESSFEPEQVPWLARLVNQPSFTGERDDVETAAAIIDAKAEEIGLRRELVPDPSETYANHRVFSTPIVSDDTPAIALVGHCDTVYPRSMGFLKFHREPSSGDRIRGPGVLDMKSGLSVILFALQALARTVPDLFARLPVRFLCNTDEEVGSPSSRAMFGRFAAFTTKALVFEGGRDEDRIITARKGTGAFTLTVTGRAAHAGNDHAAGVNAIHALALIVPQIENLTDYEHGTTTNVGTIRGGVSKNTVPGEATCVIDVRVTHAAEAKRIQERLEKIVENPFFTVDPVPDRLKDVQVLLEGGMRRAPMKATSATQQLRREYERVAELVGLGVGEAPLQGGGSDGNFFAAHGISTIDGLGPYGKSMHSPDEWSSLQSLKRRTQALACLLADCER